MSAAALQDSFLLLKLFLFLEKGKEEEVAPGTGVGTLCLGKQKRRRSPRLRSSTWQGISGRARISKLFLPSFSRVSMTPGLQWILDKQDLLKERQKDLKFLSEEEYWKLQIFFTNVIQALGEHLKLRQQVIATATVYFKRFYARYSLKSIDPVLMAPTCVFLASKVEEFGVVSNTRLISAATSVLKTRFSYAFSKEFPYRMNHILECEFYLLELMDCCLIVYHPYRPLLQYVQDMGQEDMLLPLAWRIVNDTYRTDLCLLYPPFMIALACLHVACVVQQKDARQWFAELSVDMEKILEIIRVILKLYEQWKNFDERKEMTSILSKMPKPKPPPNSESDQGPNGSQNSSYSQS
ncbi:Cyclin-C [Varanus komodoensis]|nr:Cyclin-C [Varanus komodoensis]